MIDFTLPELGENVTTGNVVRVLVKPGDALAREQPILELETDKATVEVPSSIEGRVQDVKVKVGDQVSVGQAILTVEEGKSGSVTSTSAGASGEPQSATASAGGGPPSATADTGGGRPEEVGRSDGAETQATEATKAQATQATSDTAKMSSRVNPARSVPERDVVELASASPAVRRLARELGVDIHSVKGTGPGGRISVDDIKAQLSPDIALGRGPSSPPLPDFGRWGQVERRPMSAVRRKTAEHLSASWATIPQVTQHDLADVTELEKARTRYAKRAEPAGARLTMTGVIIKVAAAALRRFPKFNSSLDVAAGEIVLKHYVNIGVAVDTDRGLLVPVIRNPDQKTIVQLAGEIAALAEKARAGKLSLEEMQGGCFTVSNLGGLGGTAFTPLVNAPEVAVLGISRVHMEPIYQPESSGFAPRMILPLSLSYDHRVVDGADGIRFLRWVAETLEDPFVLAFEA